MNYKDESQIMDALEIESWKNLSKDKMLKFVAMMPDMDKEVMLKIIDQFPEFRLFAKDVLDNMESTYKETINANTENQKYIHIMFSDCRRIIENELNKDVIFEEKKYLIEKLLEISEKECNTDIENKKFLSEMSKKILAGAGATLLAAIVFVGGKVLLNKDKA